MAARLALSACGKTFRRQVERAIKDVNVIDESNLNDVMLTVADPNEAVAYFTRRRAAEPRPDRPEARPGEIAGRARRKPHRGGARSGDQVVGHAPKARPEDRVMLADALIRSNQWDEAKAELNQIPPTHETFDRYRLEAMVADSKQELEEGRQLLRNRRRADHEAGRRAEQLGLFQADPRR